MERFIEGLKIAATHPFAFVAYIALIGCWTYLVAASSRLRRITAVLKDLPETERAPLLTREYGTFPRSGLSAEQWLNARKHQMWLIAFLALLAALTAIATIALASADTGRVAKLTSAADWQMTMGLHGIVADTGGQSPVTFVCVDSTGQRLSPESPLKLPRNRGIRLAGRLNLVIDNIFRTHRHLIYPIGLATTWSGTTYTIWDGRDAEAWRDSFGPTLVRDFDFDIGIRTPADPGSHFVLILSGAALNVDQLFAASVQASDNANAIRRLPLASFSEKGCGGFLEHPFTHPGARQERALWPLIAVPVLVD